MLASLIVQRTNTSARRAALRFVVAVLATVTVVCGAFLALDTEIPEWFPTVGRWIPAVVALAVIRAARLPGGLVYWWKLRPGGWRRLLAGAAVGVLVLVAVYAVAALLAQFLGIATVIDAAALGSVALMVPVFAVVFAVSTFGEEVAWRGFLQQAWSGWSFWRSSTSIGLVWVAFHVPLHGAMAVQGTLPWSTAVSATLALLPLGILLSAFVMRWGSVWPAVFAHAAPLTTLNLLTEPGELGLGDQLTIVAIGSALMLAAASVLSNGRRARSRVAAAA
ncbi:CPBP family glutamic-type intramembrane protease [Myceligenerans salitolerans]|nr:CPBP family glutamic-type intramembrane protease [Myceligenerans salitolerans]